MTHVNPRVLCLSDPKVSYFFLLVHSPWSTFEILLILSHFVLGIWVLYFWLRSIWKNFLYWVKLIELQRLLETFSYDISRFIKEFCVFKATIFFLIVQNVWKRTCNLYACSWIKYALLSYRFLPCTKLEIHVKGTIHTYKIIAL